MTHAAAPSAPLLCSHLILTSSAICKRTDARQQGNQSHAREKTKNVFLYFFTVDQNLTYFLFYLQNMDSICLTHSRAVRFIVYGTSARSWHFQMSGWNVSHLFLNPVVLCTHLHVRKSSQGTEKGHSFAATRGSTEHHGLVLRQPRIEKSLMSYSIYCWYHNIWGCHLVRFHLNLRNLRLP